MLYRRFTQTGIFYCLLITIGLFAVLFLSLSFYFLFSSPNFMIFMARDIPRYFLNDHDELNKFEEVWLITTAGFNSSYLLIPYFIEWYKGIGIKPQNFLLNINVNYTTDDLIKFNVLLKYLNMSNITNYKIWTEHFTSQKKTEMEQINWLNNISKYDYVMIADIDEFQDWNYFGIDNIYAFIKKQLIPNNYEYVSAYLIDRMAENATLIDPKPNYNHNYKLKMQSLFDQYPLFCHLTENIAKGYIWKIVLFRNIYNISTGRHSIIERNEPYYGYILHRYRRSNTPSHERDYMLRYQKFKLIIHHFKWNKNVILYLQKRVEYYRSLKLKHWIQSKRLLDWLNTHSGNVNPQKKNENDTVNCSLNIENHLHKQWWR
eukprot:207415_1